MATSQRSALIVALVLALALGIHEFQLLVVGHDVVQLAGGHGLDLTAMLGALPSPTFAVVSAGLVAAAFCGWWLTRSNRTFERDHSPALVPRALAPFSVTIASLGVMTRHRAERAPPQPRR